jgi:Putative beta-barrel porin-2, OmpL-like. bbp2
MRLPLCVLALSLSGWAATPDVPQPVDGPDQAPAAAPAPDAQTPAAAAAPAAPMPLSTPAITGPLTNLPPAVFDAGPFGKLSVNGFLSGMALFQDNHVPGDGSNKFALSNGQVFIQKTDGWFQFYVQAGAYTLPSLGTPFLSTSKTLDATYGPVPVAFAKFQAGKNTSFEIGALPTLIGAEYTFTFENMNVERGLLWNQESAVSRGIQVNQTMGKFVASFSWNDGFYSNRYTWLTGSLAYTNGAHALAFVGGGNYGHTAFETYATPVQNNSTIYNVIYTYTKGSWIIQPYYQYTSVPTDVKIGIVKGASTNGGAILLSHAFGHGFSLAGRYEFISSSGSAAQNSVNLLYGPGSDGQSVTVTPTFQYGGFFVRGDISWTHGGSFTKGYMFGSNGNDNDQVRALAEMGFVFGNNIVEKKP